jgi:hypothetical protein
MMNKKVYIILGGILALIIIIGVVILLTLSKSKSPSATTTPPVTTTTSPVTTTAPPAKTITPTVTQPTKISNEQVVSPILSLAGGEVWYFNSAGSLEELNLSNANLKKFVLPKNLQVDSAIWAPQNSDFIVVTDNSDGTKTYNYYSSTKQIFTQYPTSVKEVQFMPSGTQVVYIWQNSDGSSSLEIADPDLGNYKTLITKMPEADDTLALSPLGNAVLAYDSWSPKNGKLYYITLNDLKLSTIKTNAVNSALWSNDGTHYVYNAYNASDPTDATLWLGSTNKPDGLVSLGINISVNKLAFSLNGSILYYASPESGSNSDSLWSYVVGSGKKTEIYSGNSYTLNIANILVSNDGKTIYFSNTNDGYLYSVPATNVVTSSANSSASAGTTADQSASTSTNTTTSNNSTSSSQ